MAGDEQGISTSKIVAGAALGLAVPAAVGAARKLRAGDREESRGAGRSGDSARSKRSTSEASRSQSGTSGRAAGTRASGQPKASSSGRARSAASRSAATRSASSSSSASRSKKTSSSAGSRSGRGAAQASRGPTKEQLYRQATRLGVQGRSRMTKAQLERAVSRARGRS